jgi:CHAT domain-containing protein
MSLEDLMPDTGETLISYYQGDESIGAYVLQDGKTEYIELPVSTTDLSEIIRKLHFTLERSVASPIGHHLSPAAEMYLGEAYHTLIEPLEPSIAHYRVRIIANDMMAQLPIVALGDRNRGWLKDKRRIRFVSDPSRSRRIPTTSRSFSQSDNAVLAVPSATLPMVAAEAEAIGYAFDSANCQVGVDATRAQLARALQDCDGFVHIATHASRSSENPVFSRLLMNDGPYFLFDLFGTGIKARLVTLSGCQTAAPGLYYGNSLSLAKAFQQAGARYVLASLWQVSDRVAKTFMTAFYRQLKESDDVSDSYYYAIDYLQQRTPNPAHWGGFVLLEE